MLYRIANRLFPNNQFIKFVRQYKQFRYGKDGLYTYHNCDFMKEPAFHKAYLAGKGTGSWGDNDIEWRAHVVLWYAKYAFQLEGDYVECGVNKGGLSRAILDYLDFKGAGKKFFLFDTFEGFDTSLLTENEKKKYSVPFYADSYEYVKGVFRDFPFVKIIKGPVPHTLTNFNIDKVAFLSIDMNCVLPEREALEYFWPKMIKGGVIVLDDFAYQGFEEQYISHTQWAKEKGIEILSLPTGQGIIVK